MSPVEKPRPADVVWRLAWIRRVGTALAIGIFAVGYVIFFVLDSGLFDLHATRSEQLLLVGAAAAFIAIEYPLAHRRSLRFFAPARAWLDGGPVTDLAVERIHGLPKHHALSIGLEWVVCALIGGAIHLWSQPVEGVEFAFVVGAGVAFGLHLGWIVYLVVEAGLQREFAAAAAARPERPIDRSHIALRLVRTVVVAAAIVLFWVIAMVSWPQDDRREFFITTAPLTTFVVVMGLGLMAWSVRSVSATIVRLKRAVDRVEAGDLDTHVPVSDRTELGALQHSFNQMTVALRDRALLERLLRGQVGPAVAAVSREHGDRLAGERRIVSVLFVDLIGSTSLTRQMSPEAMVGLLNNYFDLVVRTVTDAGGEVLQFQGDGAICVFGAPEPLDEHAEHALRAARQLRAELDAFSVAHPGAEAAIAVSTGAVVVGHLGNDERHTYTAIGDAVNETSRLLDIAKQEDGHIVASCEAVETSGAERSAWIGAGEATLRGRDVPTVYFRPRPACPPARSEATGSGRSGIDGPR